MATTGGKPGQDPLPSWADGIAKRSIIDFVSRAIDTGGQGFLPEKERIATFDNDGTLWPEKPLYFQAFFAFDRVRALAAGHPGWKEKQPYKAIIENDLSALNHITKKQAIEMLLEVHAGTGQDEFIGLSKEWLAKTRHPRFNVLYTELIYRPMLELMEYLRSNGFKIFIVSGGGVDFIRAFSEESYGVPRDNVVGSSLEYEYKSGDKGWHLSRVSKLNKYDDKEGKPESIALHIGRRPAIVGGNSDGDLAMMRYAAAGGRPFLNILVHHDDEAREWAYDRDSHVGRLDEALKEATARGWTVVSMKKDWRNIFSFNDVTLNK